MKLFILDTSVMVDQLRTNRHRERIDALDGVLRTSAVVLAELWRGVRGPGEHAFLESLERNYPVLTPTEKNWIESGQLLAKIRGNRHLAPEKLRDLHFDVLIALTARSFGARLITSNRGDFEMIRDCRAFDLEIW